MKPECPSGARLVSLTRGLWAIVDAEDYERVSQFKWWVNIKRGVPYCYTTINKPRKHNVALHRFVTDAPKGYDVDHKLGNTLDNRKKQLRICSGFQNQRNRGANRNNKSGVKGVCWDKSRSRWAAEIHVDNVKIYLGRFVALAEAAAAYASAAAKYHKEFARVA